MSSVAIVDPNTATGAARAVLDAVQRQLGARLLDKTMPVEIDLPQVALLGDRVAA
jgi:hypothetical protein